MRTKLEDGQRPLQHVGSAESPATLDGLHSSKTKGSIQTPRQLDHRHSDLFPTLSRQQHGNTESTPRSWHARHSAPVMELVESDLFSDLTPRRSGLESRLSAPVVSPRLHAQPSSETLNASSSRPHSLPEWSASGQRAQPQSRTGLKVILKHRLAVTDGLRPPEVEELAAASAVQPPTPAIGVPAIPLAVGAPAVEQSRAEAVQSKADPDDADMADVLQQPVEQEADARPEMPAPEVAPASTKVSHLRCCRSVFSVIMRG